MLSLPIKLLLTAVPLALLVVHHSSPPSKIDTNSLILVLFVFLPWLQHIVVKLKIAGIGEVETRQPPAEPPVPILPPKDAATVRTDPVPREVTNRGPMPTIGGDDYLTRMVKYVPVETIAAFLILDALIGSTPVTIPGLGQTGLWLLVFLALLAATPLMIQAYARRSHTTATTQAVISTIGFVCWVAAIGGPFKLLGPHQPTVGAAVLLIFMAIAPLIQPRA